MLEGEHTFLRVRGPSLDGATTRRGTTVGVSSDAIDLRAVLEASRTLSAETEPDRLTARLIEILGAMTGATQVQVLLCGSESWDEALVAMSAVRYAERTLEPLLVDDACSDDRFARDPYVAVLDVCSLAVLPIVARGSLRAVAVLENRVTRGAFTADRLDAVMLITGQFGVALDNALPGMVTAPRPTTPHVIAAAETPATPSTKRAAAETELRESETRFRSAFEFSSIGLALVGLDGAFTRVNPALADMLGYSVEELNGRNIADVRHPEEVELDATAGPREMRCVHRSGRTVWVLASFSAVREGGSITGFVGQVQDITQRQLAERALRTSEDLFRTAFEGTNVGMALVDADGVFTRVNEALAALLGCSPDELAGRAVDDVTHPDDRESGAAGNGTLEKRFVHRDGTAVWVLVSVSGSVLHVQSLDDRRHAEDERRRSDERYRSVVENLPLATFRNALDDEGRNLYLEPPDRGDARPPTGRMAGRRPALLAATAPGRRRSRARGVQPHRSDAREPRLRVPHDEVRREHPDDPAARHRGPRRRRHGSLSPGLHHRHLRAARARGAAAAGPEARVGRPARRRHRARDQHADPVRGRQRPVPRRLRPDLLKLIATYRSVIAGAASMPRWRARREPRTPRTSTTCASVPAGDRRATPTGSGGSPRSCAR